MSPLLKRAHWLVLACLFYHTAWAQNSHHVVQMPDMPTANASKEALKQSLGMKDSTQKGM